MKINVSIDIPPGNSCYYPPRDNDPRGYSCGWKLTHMGARKKWCRVFDNADVTDGRKCEKCLRAAEAALTGGDKDGR